MNLFLGGAIFSAMKRFEDNTDDEKERREVLSSILTSEREIDDAYVEKYYDSHMAMLNCGGLTLVKGIFFKWGKTLLHSTRSSFNVETINRDPKNAFAIAKESIQTDQISRLHFMALCKKNLIGNTKTREEVYGVFLTKTIHARCVVVFCLWKEKNVH